MVINMKIYIVGAGPWSETQLTNRATEIIKSAQIILTTSHFEFSPILCDKNVRVLSIDKICEFLNNSNEYESVAVLASGDVGFYSIANTIKNRLNSSSDIEFISGISSFQYLSSKLMIPYENIKLVSLHGKYSNIVALASYNEYVFCLTGGENSPQSIINKLYSKGLSELEITVGSNLSYENESIVTSKISDLIDKSFDGISVLLIHNKNYTLAHSQILDEDFTRAKVPMTKQIVRDSSVALLDISPKDIVYDVGAGTGSVSIVMAKKAHEGTVYALEKNPNATELIRQNIKKLGAYNVEVIDSEASLAIEELPNPNKVFIGGSSGNLKEIVELILSKNKHADIIVTAVTLQTLSATLRIFEDLKLNTQIFNVTVAKAQKLGSYDLMTGENPVYIIKAKGEA